MGWLDDINSLSNPDSEKTLPRKPTRTRKTPALRSDDFLWQI